MDRLELGSGAVLPESTRGGKREREREIKGEIK